MNLCHLFLYVRRPKPLPLQPSEVSRDRWIGVSTFYNSRKDVQDAMEHPGICGIWISWAAPLSDSSMHTHFSLYLSMYFWSLLSSPALWHAWTSHSSPVQGCMPMKTFTPPRGYGLGAHLPSFSCNIRTKSVAMLTSSGLVKAWGAWCSQRHVIDWQQFHCGCTNWNLDSSVYWVLDITVTKYGFPGLKATNESSGALNFSTAYQLYHVQKYQQLQWEFCVFMQIIFSLGHFSNTYLKYRIYITVYTYVHVWIYVCAYYKYVVWVCELKKCVTANWHIKSFYYNDIQVYTLKSQMHEYVCTRVQFCKLR